MELRAEAPICTTIRDNVTVTDENTKDQDILYLTNSFLSLLDRVELEHFGWKGPTRNILSNGQTTSW